MMATKTQSYRIDYAKAKRDGIDEIDVEVYNACPSDVGGRVMAEEGPRPGHWTRTYVIWAA